LLAPSYSPPQAAGEGGAVVEGGNANDKQINEIDGGLLGGWEYRRLASASDGRI